MSGFITVGQLARALGITAKQAGRLADMGRLPGALRVTDTGWLRWSLTDACAALVARGYPVPQEWTQTEQAGS